MVTAAHPEAVKTGYEILRKGGSAIDAAIAFGRPVVVRMGIGTGTIAERIDAGEKVIDVAADYGLSEVEVEQAVLYERAA